MRVFSGLAGYLFLVSIYIETGGGVGERIEGFRCRIFFLGGMGIPGAWCGVRASWYFVGFQRAWVRGGYGRSESGSWCALRVTRAMFSNY